MSFFEIFGGSNVIEKGLDLIDKKFPTEIDSLNAKTEAKARLIESYSAYRVTQRYLAWAFAFVFLFILMNGVLGALYGIVPMENVKKAMEFANEMWLGEIMLGIISFYFGGGFIESIKRKVQN